MLDQHSLEVCTKKEVYAYGTFWFFQQRANQLRHRLTLLSWASAAIPVAVGVLLSTFDNSDIANYTKIISALLGGLLAIAGLWAALAGWADSLAKAERSVVANSTLQDEWSDLRSYAGDDAKTRFAVLKARDLSQEQADQLSSISQKDKAKMMRAALLQFQRTCIACEQQPTSMKPGKHRCDTCANF